MSEDAPAGGKWTATIVNFLIGTVLAGMVTSAFTYKSWREQTRLELAKQQLADATAILDKTSQLLSERLFSSYDVLAHVDADTDALHAQRLDREDKAIADWNLNFSDLLQHSQFALEISEDGKLLTYSEVATARLDRSLDCSQKFSDHNGPSLGWQNSPSWVLDAINSCFLRAGVQSEIEAYRKAPPTPDRDTKRKAIEKKLDDLNAHANNFRVSSKKAIQHLRNGVETRSYVDFLTSW